MIDNPDQVERLITRLTAVLPLPAASQPNSLPHSRRRSIQAIES